MRRHDPRSLLLGIVLSAAIGSSGAHAQSKYDPGASDQEIKLGQTAPYSGPLSSASQISLTEAAYVKMLNDKGGINGRKITLISLDDAFSPAKAVEQVRRLVEQDEVLAIYNQFGTPTSIAAQKYLNTKAVPQLFSGTGSARLSDASFPWSSAILPDYASEGAILGDYVVKHVEKAKVAALYQNDDVGKDYIRGFKDAVAGKEGIDVVKALSYEPQDPTIDSQVNTLAASGATVFLNFTTGRAAAQSIRAVANTGWKPIHLMNGRWADIGSVFRPAGVEKAVGIISAQYLKSVTDPTWSDDPSMKEYRSFMKSYLPNADPESSLNLSGYFYGQLLAHILKLAGNDLTRANINRIALSLDGVDSGLLLPSIAISTSPMQKNLIRKQILTKFNGERFVPLE